MIFYSLALIFVLGTFPWLYFTRKLDAVRYFALTIPLTLVEVAILAAVK